ncbi:hypothetical protein N752_02390 [Desulforamulus aquiferis]|nr:hypothetical protein N752_02390 [Desulforamulus aquiferis]
MSENQVLTREINLGGRTLSLETGRLAKQASGAVLAKYGDTVVLVTATVAKNTRDIDFFPLTVDYEERLYAVGKFLVALSNVKVDQAKKQFYLEG